jgi:uncharacterized membrane protein (Fun14 family)
MLHTWIVCRKGALFIFHIRLRTRSGFYIIPIQLFYQIFVIVLDRDKLISVSQSADQATIILTSYCRFVD